MEDDSNTINAMVGAGYASKPEEFLSKFDAEMRSSASDDPFTLQKFNGMTFAGLAPTRLGKKGKYNSPEGTGGAGSKAVDMEYSAYSLFDVADPPYNLMKLVKISERSIPHYAAIAAKVSNITELGFDFVESETTQDVLSEKTGTAKEKTSKKIRNQKNLTKKWFKSLNNEDDMTDVFTKVMIDYYSTGNGYIEISRTAQGQVGYVGHVPSTTIRVRKARDGYVQIVGEKVTFFRPFGRDDISDPINGDQSPNEIIHIKNYSPLSGYYGIPEIVVALNSVAGTELASRYNLDYFHNKATPRYVVVLKGGNLSETSQKQVMEFFETGVKGTNHRSLYIPLPGDSEGVKTSFEMKPVEAGVQEASFSKYIKLNDNAVLMAHRVPISKVGLAEGVSLASSRDSDKTFKEQVTRPMQARLENKINKFVEQYTNGMFEFKFNELALSDEDTKSKIHERYARNKILMPNEIRAEMGYGAIEKGDEPLELSSRQATDARAETRSNKTRDADRSASATDSAGEGRNEGGAGAKSD